MKQIAHCFLLLLVLSLVACNGSSPGPTTWLDQPLDGATLPLQSHTIQAHASDADGIVQFEFFIDDTLLATTPASGTRLSDAQVQWTPSRPGTYRIRARGTDSQGNTGSETWVRVTILGEVPSTTPTAYPTLVLQVTPPTEPQITFTADRTDLSPGECATLRWSIEGGTVFGARLNEESVALAGQRQVCPSETTRYGLDADIGTTMLHREITVNVTGTTCPGAPVIEFFRANPTTIDAGQSIILEWGPIAHATSAVIDQGIGGPQMSGGMFGPLYPTQTITYTLTATGCGGTVTKQVTVVVNPTMAQPPAVPPGCPGPPVFSYFTANPGTISAGQSSVLSWGNVTNGNSTVLVQSLTLEPGLGEVGSGASSRVVNPATTTTYTLTATGCGGTATKQVTVVVNPSSPICPGPPVIAFFTANPSTITAGQSSTLSWGTVTNATSATIDQGIGGVATPGSIVVKPNATTTYKLTATGCGGTVTRQVTLVVNPVQPPQPPPKDTTPPVISNLAANPNKILRQSQGCPSSSRTTTVTATVTDVGGVNRVVARWTLGAQRGEVTMSAVGGNVYRATMGPFNIAGNLSIVVVAWDNAGNSAQANPITVQVQECIE